MNYLSRLFGSKDKRLTQKELKIRQDEEALFSRIADPPSKLTLSSLGTEDNDDGDDEGDAPAEKKQHNESAVS
jgi:hypothetical protein